MFNKEKSLKRAKREEKERRERGGGEIIAYTTIADGEVIGLSELRFEPDKIYELYTSLSGVKKEFRGRGICKWMKTELLLYVNKKMPEVSIITTVNANKNDSIRHINDQLGFESLPISYGYGFKVDKLQKKLQNV